MAPAPVTAPLNNKKQISFDDSVNKQVRSIVDDSLDSDDEPHAANVMRDASLGGLPAAQRGGELQRAVDAALREADALAMRVIEHGDAAWQVPDETRRPTLQVVDLRGEPDPLQVAQQRMRADMHQPRTEGRRVGEEV